MFFVISKLLSFLLKPVVWILGMLLIAFLTKRPKRRKRLILASIITLYFFSNFATLEIATSLWTFKTIEVDDIKSPYDIGIVLTGYSTLSEDLSNYEHFHYFNQNANRLTQSIELYKMGKIKKMMICGGSGELIGERLSEGEKTKEFLIDMEVPEEDILIEGKSRNTIENAQLGTRFVTGLHDSIPKDRLLLLTSNFHMYRSKKSFDRAGLKTTAFSLGDHSEGIHITSQSFVPHSGAMSEWNTLIREWAAVVVYKILGYI